MVLPCVLAPHLRAPSLRAAALPALHLMRSLSSQRGGVASAAARSVLRGGGLLPVGLSSFPSSHQGACELAGASSTSSAASAPSLWLDLRLSLGLHATGNLLQSWRPSIRIVPSGSSVRLCVGRELLSRFAQGLRW
uniref:Uncharacterized protein n=1 Tax=Oryza glumipatula TaxID=40148 RepID=A0A0E0AI76_9ORYZ